MQQSTNIPMQNDITADQISTPIIELPPTTSYINQKPFNRRRSTIKCRQHSELLKKIIGGLSLLENYDENQKQAIVQLCCNKLSVEKYSQGQIVFNMGSIGDRFYIIIEGKVNVLTALPYPQLRSDQDLTKRFEQGKDKSKFITSQVQQRDLFQSVNQQLPLISISQTINVYKERDTFKEQEHILNSNYNSSIRKLTPSRNIRIKKVGEISENIFMADKTQTINSTSKMKSKQQFSNFQQQQQEQKQKQYTSVTSNLVFVKQLIKGESFGEMALIFNKGRLATIQCETDCIFAILDKESFSEILKQQAMSNINQNIKRLQQIPIFKQFEFDELKQIYLYSQKIDFKKGDIVFSQGDKADCVFFVLSGEFTIQKTFKLNFKQNQDDTSTFKTKKINLLMLSRFDFSSHSKKKFTISRLCANEMFGEEQVFLETQFREYKTECDSLKGQLLAIRYFDFIPRILKRNKNINYQLHQRIITKSSYFAEKEQNILYQFQKYQDYLIENRTNIQKQSSFTLIASNLNSPEKEQIPITVQINNQDTLQHKQQDYSQKQQEQSQKLQQQFLQEQKSQKQQSQQQQQQHFNIFQFTNKLNKRFHSSHISQNQKQKEYNNYHNDSFNSDVNADSSLIIKSHSFISPPRSNSQNNFEQFEKDMQLKIQFSKNSQLNKNNKKIAERSKKRNIFSQDPLNGFFKINISNRKQIMLAKKYEYPNYIYTTNSPSKPQISLHSLDQIDHVILNIPQINQDINRHNIYSLSNTLPVNHTNRELPKSEHVNKEQVPIKRQRTLTIY